MTTTAPTTTPKPPAPFVVHRRPPGLHWWNDPAGKPHGPYPHVSVARKIARAAKLHHEGSTAA